MHFAVFVPWLPIMMACGGYPQRVGRPHSILESPKVFPRVITTIYLNMVAMTSRVLATKFWKKRGVAELRNGSQRLATSDFRWVCGGGGGKVTCGRFPNNNCSDF